MHLSRNFLPLLLVVAALILPATAVASDVGRADQLTHLYAPAATVTCQKTADWGRTFMDTSRVELDPAVCLGALLYDASPAFVRAFRFSNPGWNVDRLIGVGVLVVLHEAQHAAGVLSESDAECRALDAAHTLLTPKAWQEAVRFDLSLPAVYHGGC